jgi:site-specific recombinase XerD
MAVLKYFANGEISAYTHNTRRKKLQKFFQWMIEEGFIASGPMATIKSGKRILNLAQEPRILSDAFSNFRTGGSLGSEIML